MTAHIFRAVFPGGKEGAILSGLVLRVGWNELHQIGKDNALTGSPRVCFRFSFRKPECLKGVCGGRGSKLPVKL